ncbi:MAG: response regulator [Ginsengibacter sp.]
MKKILVVDDDQDILEIVELILLKNGYNVKTHTTGVGLDEVTKYYKPDLILLDVRLPGGKLGTELCMELKQTISTPIILFSAELSIPFSIFCADDFIKKPFEVKSLLTTINSHLQHAA